MIRIPGGDPERLASLEWVEPDGLGGYSMGTAGFRPTRRYHALLCPSQAPPVDRRVLWATNLEAVETPEGVHRLDAWYRLSGDGPEGDRHLVEFGLDPVPRFRYRIGAYTLERRLAVPRGNPGVVLGWSLLEGPGPVRLSISPLVAGRCHHDLVLANRLARGEIRSEGRFRVVQPYQDEPSLWLDAPGAGFSVEGGWIEGVLYPEERARGYPYREDLLGIGSFTWTLGPGETVWMSGSTGPLGPEGPGALLASEIERRRSILDREGDGRLGLLALAAERFRVRRDLRLASVVAGYPWFDDWGRDAFVSLAGLEPGSEPDFAARVLSAFARHEESGLVPNCFAGRSPARAAYNSADASLWFLAEAGRLWQAHPPTREDDLWRTGVRIFEAYLGGTRHGIRVDPDDGLVAAGEEGLQLTWMDAKVDEVVVTPRNGKPVELQGLWWNATRVLAREAERLGEKDLAKRARQAREAVRRTFHASFWLEEPGWYADRLGPDGQPDPRLRPNQLLALSQPGCPAPRPAALRALEAVDSELLTPFGLRTLSPRDSEYRGHYRGDLAARDHAYHQGTVWPWLLGPYARACRRYRGHADRFRLRQLLVPLLEHLAGEGLGNLPEVFDGDAPHRPGGCPAQAWSVGEIRSLVRELEDPAPWSVEEP